MLPAGLQQSFRLSNQVILLFVSHSCICALTWHLPACWSAGHLLPWAHARSGWLQAGMNAAASQSWASASRKLTPASVFRHPWFQSGTGIKCQTASV
jgi:hypothetical protein